jgi:hypothetical protein
MAEVYLIPEYGVKWRMSRPASYRAAHSGAWPVVRIGKRLYVPKLAGDALLKTGQLPGTPHEEPRTGSKG